MSGPHARHFPLAQERPPFLSAPWMVFYFFLAAAIGKWLVWMPSWDWIFGRSINLGGVQLMWLSVFAVGGMLILAGSWLRTRPAPQRLALVTGAGLLAAAPVPAFAVTLLLLR